MSNPVQREELLSLSMKVEQLEQLYHEAKQTAEQPSLTLMIFSDNLERVGIAYTMALAAAAMGWKVNMFFAFWGISAARVKATYGGKSLIDKLITAMTGKTLDRLKLSKFNMLGFGKYAFAAMGESKQLPDCPSLAKEAAKHPMITLTACSATVHMMGIQKHELLEGVRDGGMVTFLHRASVSSVSFMV
jgi:peroxiredoxin family protein